jgi:hypothetical protein
VLPTKLVGQRYVGPQACSRRCKTAPDAGLPADAGLPTAGPCPAAATAAAQHSSVASDAFTGWTLTARRVPRVRICPVRPGNDLLGSCSAIQQRRTAGADAAAFRSLHGGDRLRFSACPRQRPSRRTGRGGPTLAAPLHRPGLVRVRGGAVSLEMRGACGQPPCTHAAPPRRAIRYLNWAPIAPALISPSSMRHVTVRHSGSQDIRPSPRFPEVSSNRSRRISAQTSVAEVRRGAHCR